MYPKLFTIPEFNLGPLNIGPIEVQSFGALMLVAFAVAVWIARARAHRFGITKDQVMDMSFWAVIVGVLGARLLYILQDLPYFLANRDELFTLKFSGLTSFGGLIAGALAIVVFARRSKIPLMRLLDLVAPSYLVGHMIGRVGCLFNGCCHGGTCSPNFIFATNFQGLPNNPYHPAQMYDAGMNLVALGILLFVLERRGLRSGQAAAFALASYGIARFIYEFWRAGTPAEVRAGLASSTTMAGLPITEAQLMSAVIVVLGAIWFWMARRNGPEMIDTPEASVNAPGEPLQEAQPA
jgi:phosphatidylglycerol---prolipoprotein diacylglyceryl transferase